MKRTFGSIIANTFFKEAIDEAVKHQVRASGYDTEREEDKNWRGLTHSDRDLPSFKQDRMLKLAHWMWDMNPLAKRQVELILDYMIGDGIEFDAVDETVLEVLEKFWDDPVNNWDLRQDDRFREMTLSGEQIYVPFVNKVNGHVRIGIVASESVERVEPNPNNRENLEYVILNQSSAVKTKVIDPITGEETIEEKTKLKIIGICDDPADTDFARLGGDVFLFQINRPTSATRGRSDLLANIDWLDAYDRFLFAALEIEELKRRMMFHLKMERANAKEIKEKRDYLQQNPVPPGGFYVSDETETIQDMAPNMRSGDLKKSSDVFKSQIFAGAGFPKHMFGVGDDVNRATAESMTQPVIRSIKRRQKYVKYMISQMFEFVIQQAQKAGALKEDVDTTFTVTLPNPSPKETLIMADALVKVTSALIAAVDAGLMEKDRAVEIHEAELAKMGHVPEEEEEEPDEEKKAEDEAKAKEEAAEKAADEGKEAYAKVKK